MPAETVYRGVRLTKPKSVLKTWLTEEKAKYIHPDSMSSYSRQLVRQNNSQKNNDVLMCEVLLEIRTFWEKRTGFEELPQSKIKLKKKKNLII